MNRWFFYFLKRAIEQRKGRFMISAISVLLTVSVLTALIMISTGVREKMGKQLSAYGANMIVSPSSGETIPFDKIKRISSISEKIRNVNYHIYGSLNIKGNIIDLIGLDISKLRGFRIEGDIPTKEDEILVGVNLAEALEIKRGDMLIPEGDNIKLKITGIFEKGSDEDSSIIMDIKEASKILGVDGISAVLMNVDSSAIEQVSDAIKREFPSLKVKTIRQVALAEEKLLRKIELLMMLVTLVVLFSSSVALGSTMGANVIERMEEIGLMKAIGAKSADVRNLFLYEALTEGVTGSVAGILVGIVMAEMVSLSAFHSYVTVKFLYLLPAVGIGVLLAVLATYLPVRDAVRTLPSVILRGE
jgi:putative ABC transport system permease protein